MMIATHKGTQQDLAGRDARMKAEVLEELRDAPIWGTVSGVWNAVKGAAAEYRKQAEGKE